MRAINKKNKNINIKLLYIPGTKLNILHILAHLV